MLGPQQEYYLVTTDDSNIIAKPMTKRVLVVITLGLFTHNCHLPLIGTAS